MPYLIDGSNVGGRLSGRSGSRDRQAVLELVLPWCRGRRKVELVFDGEDDGRLATRYGALRVVFSRGRIADDYILWRLQSGRAADWTVVTDDRALGRRCRSAGATILGSAELVASLRSEGRETAGEKPRSVDVADWEAYFAGSDSDD